MEARNDVAASIHTAHLQNLIVRIQAGDLAARDELLRGVSERLQALASHMIRGFPKVQRWAEADDVLQNAALALNACSGRGASRFNA